MYERRNLLRLREMGEYLRRLQETGPADEELGNRLQQAIDELAEMEQLALRARSKTAEAMRLTRGVLRELGIAVPALTREPTSPPGERPSPGPEGIMYASTAPGPCLSCGEEVGAGPVGWGAEPAPGPLCDECLANRGTPLYILLVIAHMMRELGEAECASEEDERVLMVALTTMMKGFEKNVLRSWPPAETPHEPLLFELLEEIAERNARAD